MKIVVSVTDPEGNLFGEFEIDGDWVGNNTSVTLQDIGDEVVCQLPGGIDYLKREE